MINTPLAILTTQGRHIVAALSGGGIPRGLAVTLMPLEGSARGYLEYSVTHVSSGRRVVPTGFATIDTARAVAKALHRVADWSLPAFAIRALPGIETQVREALERVLTELEGGE